MSNEANPIVIGTNRLSVGYNGQTVVSGINFNAGPSCFIALLGRNGIGKSTLLKTLAGLLLPVSGSIDLFGTPMHSHSRDARARLISYVSTETIHIPNMPVHELVAAGRYPYTPWTGMLSAQDRQIVQKAMEIVGIRPIADKEITCISDGERQKALIARAIAQDTPIIILDEPTAWLDLPSRYELITLMAALALEAKKTIICSTHEMSIAMKKAHQIWLIAGKEEIYTGTPVEITNQQLLERIGVTF